MVALQAADWPRAVDEFARVLAPGGWAVVGEYGMPVCAGPATDAYMRLYTRLVYGRGLHLRVFAALPDMLRDAGLVNVRFRREACPLTRRKGVLGQDGADNIIASCRAITGVIVAAGGFGLVSSAEEVEAMIDAMEAEWHASDDVEIEFVYVYGQKPMEA